MLRHQPYHQSQRPRQRTNLYWQSERVRAVYRREPSLRPMWVCAGYGRGGRCAQSTGAKRWVVEECVEWKQSALGVRGFVLVKGDR